MSQMINSLSSLLSSNFRTNKKISTMKLNRILTLAATLLVMMGCSETPNDEGGANSGGRLTAPTGVALVEGSLTTNSATVQWDEVANAAGYKYNVVGKGVSVASGEVTQTEVALSGLEKSTEYSVQVMAVAKAPYQNSLWSNVLKFTTLMRNPSDAVGYNVAVSKDGSADYTTVQAAIDNAPGNRTEPYVIYVTEGIYDEKISIGQGKDNVVLVGDGADKTILTHDGYQGGGEDVYCTLYIRGKHITVMDMTIRNTHQNNTGSGDQAQAVMVHYGDYISFFDCNIMGYQDTFWGRSSESRVYVKDCLVEGNVDFIYGGSVMLFEDCRINVNRDKAAITAPSTPVSAPYGIVFKDCNVTNDAKGFNGVTISKIYLGRAWHYGAKSVWLGCTMPATLDPTGWMENMSEDVNDADKIFAEWGCNYASADSADLAKRTNGGRALSDEEAALYTHENIFAGVEDLAKMTTKPYISLE